jgi:diaminohydroxyphosphoribosylaminopyrimidine deaminase/5-amino-6-(5-phosphoribosylamino)uracil reductase
MKLKSDLPDENYMKRALNIAKLGEGFVNPNPMVGAVIVKDGKIIGEGYHKKYGEAHAEPEALASCKESVKGADLYVTLEPCCFHGKTPPCTEAIINSGIKRVYIGSLDPNPKVAGKGVQILREHNLEVTTGILKEECDNLNKVFFHYIQQRTPYIIMKYAMTMDGKIATVTGKSKWITGEVARKRVHHDRHRYMGIMVGVETILKDNPTLDCRLVVEVKGAVKEETREMTREATREETKEATKETTREKILNSEDYIDKIRNPIRIICDTNLRTPLDAKVIIIATKQTTIIATSCSDKERWKPYQKAGCEILLVSKDKTGINLNELIDELGKRGIDSIILEGGSTLNGSFITNGLVNKVQCYIAPKIFGGKGAISPVGGLGIDLPKDCIRLSPPKIEVLGEDILLESEVLPCLQG